MALPFLYQVGRTLFILIAKVEVATVPSKSLP